MTDFPPIPREKSLLPVDWAQLVYCPHPILVAQGRRIFNVRAGEPLAGLLRPIGPLDKLLQAFRISLSGVVIESADDLKRRVQPGDIIGLQARMLDTDGSDTQRIFLTVAVMVAAYYTGGVATTAYGSLAGAAVTAGASAVGTYLINQMYPVAGLDSARLGEDDNTSPTYSLTSGRNRARPWQPLPVSFGRIRVRPDYSSTPYTEYDIDGEQYLYQIFNFGLSPVALSDFKIGDTPLSNFSTGRGKQLYKDGLLLQVSNADGKLPDIFSTNVDSLNVSTELTQSAGWITRTSSTGATALAVDIVGNLYQLGADGLDALSATFEIEWRKLGGSWSSLVLDWPSPQQYSHYWSAGYTLLADEFSIVHEWVQVDYAHPNTAYTAGDPYTHPDYNGPSATWELKSFDDSELINAPKPERTYYDPTDQLVLTNDSSEPVRLTLKVPTGNSTDTAQQYEVRARRISSDETDEKKQSTFYWQTLRSYQIDQTDYRGQTRVGLRIKADGRINGVVDQISAVAETRIPVINSSGEEKARLINNPAWLYLWFARGRYSPDGIREFGAGLADTRIDLDTIKDWAAWCESKSLAFNYHLDTTGRTVRDILILIAQAGRASPTWVTGKLGVVWDAANQPVVQRFGMPNIIAGSFRVSYIGGDTPEEVVAHYLNEENDFKPDRVRVAVPNAPSNGRILEIHPMGETHVDQVTKTANLTAAGTFYRKRRVRWQTDLEGLMCTRGNIVELAHDLTSWGYSGRLVAGPSTTSLTLDRPVTFESTADHWIMLRAPDGSMGHYEVDSPGTDISTDQITLLDALPSAPDDDPDNDPMDYVWQFGPEITIGKKLHVVDFVPIDEYTIELVAMDYEPLYYDQETNLALPPAVTHYVGAQAKPLDIEIAEQFISGSGLNRVTVSPRLQNAQYFSLTYSINGGLWQKTGPLEVSWSIELDIGATLDVECRVVTFAKNAGVVISKNYTVTGSPVATPANFSVTEDTTRPVVIASAGTRMQPVRVTWTAQTAYETVGYELQSRLTPSGDWGTVASTGDRTTANFEISLKQGVEVELRLRALSAGNKTHSPWASLTYIPAVTTDYLSTVGQFIGVPFPVQSQTLNLSINIDNNNAQAGLFKILEYPIDGAYDSVSFDGIFSVGGSKGRLETQSRVSILFSTGSTPQIIAKKIYTYSAGEADSKFYFYYETLGDGTYTVRVYVWLQSYEGALLTGDWAVNTTLANGLFYSYKNVPDATTFTPAGTAIPATANYQTGATVGALPSEVDGINNAQTTADNAGSLAGSAQNAADNAQTTADNAGALAGSAQNAADNAQTTADNAGSLAGSAQNAADAAQDTADRTEPVELISDPQFIKTVAPYGNKHWGDLGAGKWFVTSQTGSQTPVARINPNGTINDCSTVLITPTKPGREYSVSVDYYVSPDYNSKFQVFLDILDTAKNRITINWSPTLAATGYPTGWQTQKFLLTASDDDAALVRVQISDRGTGSTGYVAISRISVIPVIDYIGVVGDTRPEDNATVGGQLGTNIVDETSSGVDDLQALNANQRWNEVEGQQYTDGANIIFPGDNQHLFDQTLGQWDKIASVYVPRYGTCRTRLVTQLGSYTGGLVPHLHSIEIRIGGATVANTTIAAIIGTTYTIDLTVPNVDAGDTLECWIRPDPTPLGEWDGNQTFFSFGVLSGQRFSESIA